MVNGKRLDDSEKIRSLTRTLQNQIKQASKKELMGDSKKDGKVLFFASKCLHNSELSILVEAYRGNVKISSHYRGSNEVILNEKLIMRKFEKKIVGKW